MEYIIGFVINFLNFFACDNLMSAFFKTNAKKHKKFIAYLIKFILMNIVFEQVMSGMSIPKAALVLVTDFVLFFSIYRTPYLTVVLLMWRVISSTFEYMAISVCVLPLNISLERIFADPFIFTAVAVTYNGALYISSLIIKLWVKNNLNIKYISKKEWLLLAGYPFTNYLVVYIMLYDAFNRNDIRMSVLIISVMLILLSMLMFYLFSEISKSNMAKQELIAKEREEIAKQEYLNAVQSAYQKQRRLTHDFNRELATLKSILELKDYTKLETYLNKLVGNSQKNRLVVLTHNTIIDAILNQKYTEAKNQGIGMEFILDDLAGLPMSDEDIVIILTNLIDNAMNAAKKADLKMIQVFMSYDKKEFLCAVKNSVAEKVPIENNEVMLKPADIYHGFGLKNVRSVLSKYDSIYSLESTDDRFIFTMLIYF